MSDPELSPAVVLIFLNKTKVLLEKRPAADEYPAAALFPGGKVEEIDLNIVDCLIREVREELGITPLWFKEIPQSDITLSPTGRIMYPFYVTVYNGDLPDKILDKGYPLFWEELDSIIDSPIPSVRKIALDFKEFLNK